jgi:TetR/AcrR family transcriptional regulator, regulator of autoinduction and epiphytic fitness
MSDPAAEPAVETDGRRARRDRNKVAVVDAYLDLVREGTPRPSVADVAERSGVSYRSVFRYFDDRDELARVAIDRQQERVLALAVIEIDPAAPLGSRIELMVDARVALYEAIAPVARLSRSLAQTQQVLADQLHRSRRFFRAQLRKLFGPELAVAADADSLSAMLEVVTSFEAYDLLREDQGLGRARARTVMLDALGRVLGNCPNQ